MAQLDLAAPRFALAPQAVTILSAPDEFYSQLKARILGAQRRIFLATLYIGKSEDELISVLDQSLQKNNALDVHILTDGLRGTREAPQKSTASLLAPLVAKYPARVHVSMYQTPALNGLAKLMVPQRFNEGWGLQHMKLYGFDDDIVLSGANLSKDYFTNRQDRYIAISNKEVTEYFYQLHKAVSYLSYQLQHEDRSRGPSDNFKLVWTSDCPSPADPKGYRKEASRILAPLLKPDTKVSPADDKGTYLYPIAQFTPLIGDTASNELKAMGLLTKMLKGNFDWTLTAGYFNISERLQEGLLKSTPGTAKVITAGEKANGFYQSKGVSSQIPDLYSMLAKRFIKKAEHIQPRIQMLEWENGQYNKPNGWSYHAKGLWVMPRGESPVLTVIGSSNFTKRAYAHDLEAGAVLVTGSPELRAKMAAEVANLEKHTTPKTSRDYNKRPTLIQRLFVRLMGNKL